MSERAPLLFRVQLGALRPESDEAATALKAIGGNEIVRIEIKKVRGNVKRLRWYWKMLSIALDNLSDAFDGPVTTEVLHKWLKREAGLAKPVRSLKTGEIIDYDYDSIAFHNMTEDQRAAFVDFASQKLAARLGVPVETLTREAKAA